MSESPRIMIALDIDGVLNMLPLNMESSAESSVTDTESCLIGGYRIQWRPAIIARLREILLRPDVEAAWLTTWLPHPARIRELELAIGLVSNRDQESLVKHLALHPIPDYRSEIFPEDVSLMPSPKWWKHYAAAELRERIQPQKFTWVDDDLGREKDPTGIWQPQETDELLLLRTDPTSGLSTHNLDQLEQWIGKGRALDRHHGQLNPLGS